MEELAFKDEQELWAKVTAELSKLIPEEAFQKWFVPIRPLGSASGSLVLGIDNSIYQYWIEENYLSQLNQCIELVTGKAFKVSFEILSDKNASEGTTTDPKDKPIELETQGDKGGKREKETSFNSTLKKHKVDLIPRYIFESFVVGINNQFAHAAACAVADAPAKTYNPLFIHGAVGLGKTHLMHAIGHRLLQNKSNARVVYVTSEQFTNSFVTAIQHGELTKFRRHYRQADALLIDDVQFFAGKERSQEEFFHTFNALSDGNKQIVLTSDRPPSEVQNLEQRLVSRFEWGLTAELQPPDIETRLAILKAKADKLNVRLGDSVLLFIAERVKANIRRLEGALNRVAAWAALSDQSISQAQIEELLKDFIQQEARNIITVESIQRKVADNYDIRMTDMTSKRRPNNIAYPRMVAMYLSRKYTSKSLQEIGEAFGGRDHGTVLHACKTVEKKIEGDRDFKQQLNFLCQKLESPQ